ncbi:hypothetical protein PG993_013219 [Apiospora rasikravindrae]|uniref:Uncharacterized protein n=1 Tax=Apiospora rasikravindrae TaxID=990691 RepID=A0ABR1RX26_9PEZI
MVITLHVVVAVALGLVVFGMKWKITHGAAAEEAQIGSSGTEADEGDRANSREAEESSDFKQLYFKLHNLERHADILGPARESLVTLLRETSTRAKRRSCRGSSILSMEEYNATALEEFLMRHHEMVMDQWQEYLTRRTGGQGPELFGTLQEAERWLRRMAPIKYVDGAWLGYAHRLGVTTPFALRLGGDSRVIGGVLEILTEELGDGHVERNHVFLYRKLLRSVIGEADGSDGHVSLMPPTADSLEFVERSEELGMDDPQVWKAATAQLLISLFPDNFMPEILGFNLHYEPITLQTLVAMRELEELGVDACYFRLHACIDNADTGHAAMALEIVVKYLQVVREMADGREEDGKTVVQEAWRRIRAGYVLSQELSQFEAVGDDNGDGCHLTGEAASFLEILRLKSRAGHRLHCRSRARIGPKLLADWLFPELWRSKRQHAGLLDALAATKPWVHRGNSDRSLLVRELSWKGKMFGAFTEREVQIVKNWIDSLGSDEEGRRLTEEDWDVSMRNMLQGLRYPLPVPPPASQTESFRIRDLKGLHLSIEPKSQTGMLSLWFTHPCLLQNILSIPYRTMTPLAGYICRILKVEQGSIAPNDCHTRSEGPAQYLGLIDLGLEMVQRRGGGRIPPTCLEDVFQMVAEESYGGVWTGDRCGTAVTFARAMLHWAMQPVACRGLLLGLSRAFVDLEFLVSVTDGLLSVEGQKALGHLASCKLNLLDLCLREIRSDQAILAAYQLGYNQAWEEIEKLLSEDP